MDDHTPILDEDKLHALGLYCYTKKYLGSAEKWREVLSHLIGKSGVRMLEIGSFEGRSAVWWLENILTHNTSKLICVDPWSGREDKEKMFDLSIMGTGRSSQVVKHKNLSRKVVPQIADSSLHAAYVDGCHASESVLFDALAVLPKMQIGGIIIFDDYTYINPNWPKNATWKHTRTGLDAFLNVCRARIKVIHKERQLIVKRVK